MAHLTRALGLHFLLRAILGHQAFYLGTIRFELVDISSLDRGSMMSCDCDSVDEALSRAHYHTLIMSNHLHAIVTVLDWLSRLASMASMQT